MIRFLTFVVYLLIITDTFSQKANNKFSLCFGYEGIPLYVNRTEVTRWMIFPNFFATYTIKDKIEYIGSVSIHDIRLSNYSAEQYRLNSETPVLHTYEEAVEYIGEKSDPTELNSYIFLGAELKPFKSGFIRKSGLLAQIGFRQGYTFILEHVFKEPNNPNGFEAHLSHQTSNSIGAKLGLSQSVQLIKPIFLKANVGTYIFTNWPVAQIYGNLLVGLHI